MYIRKGGSKVKVIKRDGRTIDFDRSKVELAIQKANREVRGKEKATKQEINEIIGYIEELGKKRMLVEDIQDVIEEIIFMISIGTLKIDKIIYPKININKQ